MANISCRFVAVARDGLLVSAPITSYLLVPDTTSVSSLVSSLSTWSTTVDACIDAAITDVSARLVPPLPAGLKAPTGATWESSRVEQTGVINFSAAGSSHRYGQALPSISNGAISSGKINLTNTAIQSLIALCSNPANNFTNAESQALGGAIDALLSFRKRADLRKTSYET
jgi:hypothetical protein